MNIPKKWLLYLGLLFVLSAMLCGCGPPSQVSETVINQTSENRLYVYAVNGKWGILNAAGTFIVPPQENKLNLIQDRFTGEQAYIQMTKPIAGERIEYTLDGSDKTYSYYDNNRFLYDIYNTDGTLLYENLENTYCNAMGDFLILSQEDANSCTVINPKSGEKTVIDTDWVDFCGNMFVFNWRDEPCARFYDQNMQLVREIPGYTFHYNMERDGKQYLVMMGKNNRIALFDAAFNLLLPAEYTAFEQICGDFVQARDANHQSIVVSLATGETIIPPQEDKDVYYYDGDMVLYRHLDENNQPYFSLVNLKDENQTWTAPYIYGIRNYYRTSDKAMGFYIESPNSKAIIVNPQGETILDLPAQSWVEEVSNHVIAIKHNRAENRPMRLYTWSGKEIPTGKTYYTINSLSSWDGRNIPYFAAYYETRQGTSQIDLLDENGHILIENLRENTTLENDDVLSFFCDGYRVLARKGFSQGMLDMEGNWIYKESVFDSFANEY